ncbi:unnamed protein product [Adineta ricciae]|uniref:Uncharacterized protein n=1 Tax=Adineta ricciae TaxID=249248 RepID=A0A815ESG7_ADIRI|nr:unnamed protein product [Adineta ricciae]CAF1551437.1 unnamed protein product [Adineta ricciae]
MDDKDEQPISDASKSIDDTEPFPLYLEQAKSSFSLNNTDTNYLQINVSEPLDHALTYVLIYRPHDAIEFIAIEFRNHLDFLIDWSRQKTQQVNKSELRPKNESDREKFIVNQQEEEQLTTIDENVSTPDERDEFREQIYRTEFKQSIHTHDTASGMDDDIRNNFDRNENHICHNDHLSTMAYFCQLKEKLIRCHDS